MLFFKRILNNKAESVEQTENRLSHRYPVGANFPRKTAVNLIGRDDAGLPLNLPGHKGRDWGGRLLNLSSGGANIGLAPAALAERGEPCKLKLTLGEDRLEIPCTVAHFRAYTQYTACGLKFAFPDADTQRAYLQLLEPVAIGASLKPAAGEVVQDTEGLVKEEYHGDSNALLAVWRERTGMIYGFDFRMNAYGVRWGTGMPELQIYGLNPDQAALRKPGQPLSLTEAQQIEVRWLFCLAVPNLAKAVPADIRKFLEQLVS